jgi:hypothetical protein
MKVMTTNDRSAFMDSISATGKGRRPEKYFPRAASQALAARETRSKNAMPTTIVNDQIRVLMTPRTPRSGR